MRNKKKIEAKPFKMSNWLIISLGIFLLIIIFSMSNTGKILSDKIFLQKEAQTGTSQRIPITVKPLMEGLTQDEYSNMAMSDLSNSKKIELKAMRVKSVVSMDWNNASLGCPEEGMVYAQVITPGYIITLEALGREYIYHAGNRRVVLCEK